MHACRPLECAFSCVVTSRQRVASRRHSPPANSMFMPVYSNTQCCVPAACACVIARCVNSAMSYVSTCEQRDACRKKTMRGCDNAREFFARSHAIDALHACASTCCVCLSMSLMRFVCALHSHAMRDVRARCNRDAQHGQRHACTCRNSHAAHRRRDRRGGDARRGGSHRRIRIEVDAR